MAWYQQLYVCGLRHLRRIVPQGTHSYPVNDDKARWAELDDDLWEELSSLVQQIMIRAEEYVGDGTKGESRDESRVCELGVMLEMIETTGKQWRKNQGRPTHKCYGVRLPMVNGHVTDRPCHVVTDCHALHLGKRYLADTKGWAHSGLSDDNWALQFRNPLLWSSQIDPTGVDHKNLHEKMSNQTEDCPAGVDGDLLFKALQIFVRWTSDHGNVAFIGDGKL